MTLSEILQVTGEIFKVMWRGFIALSGAHPLLDAAGLLAIVGAIIGLFKR